MNFEDLSKLPNGTVLRDWNYKNVRCLIIKNHFSLCAYFGIPLNHHFLKNHEDEEDMPLDCHYGITHQGELACEGISDYQPSTKDFYFFGWDYAHSGDATFYTPRYYDGGIDFERIIYNGLLSEGGIKEWLVEDVEEEMNNLVEDFIKIIECKTWMRNI